MFAKARWPIVVAASAIALFGAHAQQRVVNVYNWADFIDPALLDEFTKETGIKVVWDAMDSNEILETKMLTGGSGYDVVAPDYYYLPPQIAAGAYQKLDKSKLPNLVNMWDDISKRVEPFDPDNAYSINYMWSSVGIGYNGKKVKEALGVDKIDSWAAIFDPAQAAKLKDCGISFLDSPTNVIPVVLAYLGRDPNSHDPADITAASEALMKVRPYVRKFHSSDYISTLASGDICVAIGWSGDVYQAASRTKEAKNGIDISYAIPKEGTQVSFTQLAIPADAPHPNEAHEFLNYLMRPEVIAKASNYVFYANGNKASEKFLTPELLNDPAIYPDAATWSKLFVPVPLDPGTQRLFTRTWTRILTGQ